MKLANIVNTDGWMNFFAGLGNKKDRVSNTNVAFRPNLDKARLEELYARNGFGRKVIDILANEMTREWIEVENDTEHLFVNGLKRIRAKESIRNLLKWGNLYGGAVIVMGIDDGGLLEQPLNEGNIANIEWLRVYDRHQVQWQTTDINEDPESKNFGEPEFYNITAYRSATQFKVHHSRILKYEGMPMPERCLHQNSGWGQSLIDIVYEELKQYGAVKSSSANIIMDFIQTILQIDGLTDMIANGQEDVVKKRLDIMDLSRAVNNTILLDKDEEFSKSASSVTGLADLINQFMMALSAVTGIPVTKLFGQSPAGLNATGESDIRNFYDEIKSRQEDVLLPMLERLQYIMSLAKQGEYKGAKNVKDHNITFNPLWQMTDIQEAEWKYKVAQTDDIYLKNAVLSPEEVATSRFADGYSTNTEIDNNNRPLAVEDEPEESDT